ncbi:hypothetical protein PG989_012228 [Apiospora arundinis]|uniref:Uncharacterized protein n=1 Tax=Apiospora arundinis TaxID=335852 RepID=A0ABR2IJ58_9PEZI
MAFGGLVQPSHIRKSRGGLGAHRESAHGLMASILNQCLRGPLQSRALIILAGLRQPRAADVDQLDYYPDQYPDVL